MVVELVVANMLKGQENTSYSLPWITCEASRSIQKTTKAKCWVLDECNIWENGLEKWEHIMFTLGCINTFLYERGFFQLYQNLYGWMQDVNKWFGKWEASYIFSWCINRFLHEWGIFAMRMYDSLGKAWQLTSRTLYYIRCAKLQIHHLLKKGKVHSFTHGRAYHFVYHLHHCFKDLAPFLFHLKWAFSSI